MGENDRFVLRLSSSNLPPWKMGDSKKLSVDLIKSSFLWGCINIGENTYDTWFMVFMLTEITKKLSDIAVKVWSLDGQFLITEAYHLLPEWLQTQNMDSRVFL